VLYDKERNFEKDVEKPVDLLPFLFSCKNIIEKA
jgi:hypothetical protein